MKAYKVEEVNFVNKVNGKVKLELQNKYAYNVRYNPSRICRGEFTATVSDKNNPENFSIKVVVIGVFEFDEGIEKEFIHVETYNALFPFVRSAVTTLTANAGIPPVIIPMRDIEGENIYRFEKNGRPE